MVGRDFPPFEKTHARISLGTMDEMKKATAVFRSVLRPVTTTAGQTVGGVMALSRRGFVQTVGVGAAAAWIGARGRENSIWSAFEPTLQAVEPGTIVLGQQRESARPGQDGDESGAQRRSAKAAARPAATPAASGDLIDAHRQAPRRQAGEHRPRLRLDADPAHRPRISSRPRTSRSSAPSRPTRSAPATPR